MNLLQNASIKTYTNLNVSKTDVFFYFYRFWYVSCCLKLINYFVYFQYTTTDRRKLTAVKIVATSSSLYILTFFATDLPDKPTANTHSYCHWNLCVRILLFCDCITYKQSIIRAQRMSFSI